MPLYDSPTSYLTRNQQVDRQRRQSEQLLAQRERLRQEEENRRREQFRASVAPALNAATSSALKTIRDAAVQRIQGFKEQEDRRQEFRSAVQPTLDKVMGGLFGGERGRPSVVPAPTPQEIGQSMAARGEPMPVSGQYPGQAQQVSYFPGAQNPSIGQVVRPFITPLVSNEQITNVVNRVPLARQLGVGEVAGDVLSPLTTSLGAMSLVAPATSGATVAGTAGAFVGGEAGNALEAAGLGNIPTPLGDVSPKTAGELLGGFYQGGKKIGPVERTVTENVPFLRNRYLQEHGVAPIAGATDVSPGIAADTAIAKVNAALQDQATKLGDVTQVRGLERAQRSAIYTNAYESALKSGMTPEQARLAARPYMSGEYAKQVGSTQLLDLTEPEKVAIWSKIDEAPLRPFEQLRAADALAKVSTGQALQKNELKLLGRIYGTELPRNLQRTGFLERAYEIAMIPKSILSSADLSFLGRQGIIYAAAHPIEWAKSWVPTVRAAFSEKYYQGFRDTLANDPRTWNLADGTSVTRGEAHQLLMRAVDAPPPGVGEVAYGRNLAEQLNPRAIPGVKNTLVGRIPGIGDIVRGSNRAFSAAGEALRTSVQDTILKSWEQRGILAKLTRQGAPEITRDRLERLSAQINRATGRGLIQNETAAKALQALWWAPQQTISVPQFVGYAFNTDAIVRQQAWRDIAAFVTAGTTIMGLAKLAGGDITTDPRSSSFGKVTGGPFGDAHINVFGSSQVLARYATQFALSQKVSASGGKPYFKVRGDTALEFFRSRLSPLPGLATDIAFNETYTHEPVTLKNEAVRNVIPLAGQDAYEAYQTSGLLPAAATGAFSGAGGGIQTYTPSTKQQVYDMSRYQDLTPEQDQQLRDFQAEVEAEYQAARRAGVDTTKAHVATVLGQNSGRPNLGLTAANAIQGHLSPNWDRIAFAVDHQDDLDGQTLANVLPIAVARGELSDKNFQKYLEGRTNAAENPDVLLSAGESIANAAQAVVP